MKTLKNLLQLAGLVAASLFVANASAEGLRVAAASCDTPPYNHCSRETGCAAESYSDLGNAVEPKSGRPFYLDYPCDLKPGEKVNLILSIHGGGSIATWHRHYFPAVDYKDKYRLVIITPTAKTDKPVRMWTPDADDQFLQDVVDYVVGQFGKENIRSFWLAGHSQGGMTSNRIVCNDYFKDKVDGWLSLSGGRIGPVQIASDFFGEGGTPPAMDQASGGTKAGPGRAVAPTCDISYIFETGEMEMQGVPKTSPWAKKYHCAARVRGADIVDTEKGYVTGKAEGRGASWGRDARPGTAQVYTFPHCDGGKVIADVIRLDKGHTEGLEPKVTEELIKMIVAAPGGKLNKM